MKNPLIFTLFFAVFIALNLNGCGNDTPSDKSTTASQAKEKSVETKPLAEPKSATHPDKETPVTAPPPAKSKPDPTTLDARVLARWKAMKAEDFKEAYRFFSPSFRKLFPLDYYLKSTGSNVKWIYFKIKEKNINGERAEVLVDVRYKLNLPGPGASIGEEIGTLSKRIKEVWLWRDGNWWFANPPEKL